MPVAVPKDPQLTTKLANRADQLVRQIVSGYQKTNGWSDAEVLTLRVLIGMALHDAAAFTLLHTYTKRLTPAPAATTSADPAFDSEATTEVMKPHQSPPPIPRAK